MPFRPSTTFANVTARLGAAEYAPAQPVTLAAIGDGLVGVLGAPVGSPVPMATERLRLTFPGHGEATVQVVGLVPGEPSALRLRVNVEWVSPGVAAACSAAVAA